MLIVLSVKALTIVARLYRFVYAFEAFVETCLRDEMRLLNLLELPFAAPAAAIILSLRSLRYFAPSLDFCAKSFSLSAISLMSPTTLPKFTLAMPSREVCSVLTALAIAV